MDKMGSGQVAWADQRTVYSAAITSLLLLQVWHRSALAAHQYPAYSGFLDLRFSFKRSVRV